MEIFEAQTNDLPAILSLQKLAFQSEAQLVNDYSIPPLTQTLEEITLYLNKGTILKAVKHDNPAKIIGSVRGHTSGNTLHIGRLIVDPLFQNKGIGTALLLRIEAMFPSMRYELFTSDRSNRNLILYIKNGYKEFRREPFNENVNLVFLEKYG